MLSETKPCMDWPVASSRTTMRALPKPLDCLEPRGHPDEDLLALLPSRAQSWRHAARCGLCAEIPSCCVANKPAGV